MKVFRARLRRVGGSLGVLVPKDVVKEVDAAEGDTLEFAIVEPSASRKRRLERLAGAYPGLKPFSRDREDRF